MTAMTYREYLAYVKQKLDENGLTQADLARAMGVQLPQLNRWVRGATIPRADSVDAIKAALHTLVTKRGEKKT